jgi:thioredoxin-related protein
MNTNKVRLNIATAVALFAIFAAAVYSLTRSHDEDPSELVQRGMQQLQNVDWHANRQTLVMAIRPGCHYCTASAGFYRDIVRSNGARGVHLLAISPTSVDSTRTYLNKLGVGVTDVREADLASFGVEGTPTLILVDEKGRAQAQWVGQLPAKSEAAVFRKVHISRSRAQS